MALAAVTARRAALWLAAGAVLASTVLFVVLSPLMLWALEP